MNAIQLREHARLKRLVLKKTMAQTGYTAQELYHACGKVKQINVRHDLTLLLDEKIVTEAVYDYCIDVLKEKPEPIRAKRREK